MAAVLFAAILWSYWTTLAELVDRWAIDPQYSHGFLVPVFAAVILWVQAEGRWPSSRSAC